MREYVLRKIGQNSGLIGQIKKQDKLWKNKSFLVFL